jgi:hypothetical protein
MTIGVWEPQSPSGLTLEQIQSVLSVVKDIEMNELASTLEDSFIASNSGLMNLDKTSWQEATHLSFVEIEALIRFFTLAEMQLPGWEGGNRSPVIYLAKILKTRGEFSTELKKWVKANTDNRYLPNGSVL